MSTFVIWSNLASLPCIVYYSYHRLYLYSFQLLVNSVCSVLHHSNAIQPMVEGNLMDTLDGLESYLSVYLFSVYLLLLCHAELRTELFITHTILTALVYASLGAIIVLPVTLGLILLTVALHPDQIRPLTWSRWWCLTLFMAAADLACFLLAFWYEYDIVHGLHHLLAFTLPFPLHRASEEPQRIVGTLETHEARMSRLHQMMGSPMVELTHPRVIDANGSPSLEPLRI